MQPDVLGHSALRTNAVAVVDDEHRPTRSTPNVTVECGSSSLCRSPSATVHKHVYRHISAAEYGRQDGEPYGCLVADYYFDHSGNDLEILLEMARIAAGAHAPFVAGASPMVMQMADWRELANPRNLAKIFSTPEYGNWLAFRESEDSRYVCLTLPRFLARPPYGARSRRVEEFAFEERTGAGDHALYCWANSSYAMAANIGRAVSLYGWCARIRGFESGGLVDNLPMVTFPSEDGGSAAICPTEISVSERREVELGALGFAALVHRKYTDVAAFVSAPSLRRPLESYDPDATLRSKRSARLPCPGRLPVCSVSRVCGTRGGVIAAGSTGPTSGLGRRLRRP